MTLKNKTNRNGQHLTATNGHWAGEGHRRALLTRSLREFLFAVANKVGYL